MNEEIKSLFVQDMLKDNFTYPRHRFSLRYRYRKNQIIKNFLEEERANSEAKSFYPSNVIVPVRKRLKYLLIIIVLLSLILGFTIYKNYSGFVVREYDCYSMMSAQQMEDAPKKLTKKFYIDLDLSEYEMKVMDDNEYRYWIIYKLNGEEKFSIIQTAYEGLTGRINTEDDLITPSHIEVNGWSGMCFQMRNEAYCYYFDVGDCLIRYITYLNENEIENLVKATKFA